MLDLAQFAERDLQNIEYVFTDIDDTLTDDGRLSAKAYAAMESLEQAGIQVIPITGRPAGWCDLIARLWPVSGVVGENGALYYRYDREQKRMQRHYADNENQRIAKRKKLAILSAEILSKVPGAAISVDQFCRETDLAVDFAEDVAKLDAAQINHIVDIFQQHGATAKVSSIHVNGWFGDYDKLTMTRTFASQCLHMDLAANKHKCIFVGDSPNDAPMFNYFPYSVGVANLLEFTDRIDTLPAFITKQNGGNGFSEVAMSLITAQKSPE